MIKNIFDDKKGRVKKFIIIFLLIIFIFLIPLGIYASENTTNVDDNSVSEQPPEEIMDNNLIEEPIIEIPNEIVEEIPEEVVVNETIVEEVIENVTEESNLEGDNLANETEIIENATEESNLEENISSNETTSNKTNTSSIENQTNISEEEAGNIPPIQTTTSLSIQISHPEKITRGEIVNLNATITNRGDKKIDSILLNWIIPTSVNIISGENTKIISLDAGESYIAYITIETSSSIPLGINEIKLGVNY